MIERHSDASRPISSSLLPNRRQALAVGGALGAGAVAAWLGQARRPPAAVFIARRQRYDQSLVQSIRDGLIACEIAPEWWRGKRVLLKPNLVEPTRAIPHMTTHPAVILATAQVFRTWGATVRVGEAPGHVRDTEMALYESGVAEALRDEKIDFADLNYQEVAWRPNLTRASRLNGLYFPRDVLEADVVVSLPKLKTHHWVGMTCSLKNMYGTLPGVKYGWPKNVLHHNGIAETVVDINGALPPTLTIVDAIDCMEGDGPILGSCKPLGILLVGRNLSAVDATAARIMGLTPSRIDYLRLAAKCLGPISENAIIQRGELWESVASPFKVLSEPHLQKLRATSPNELHS